MCVTYVICFPISILTETWTTFLNFTFSRQGTYLLISEQTPPYASL